MSNPSATRSLIPDSAYQFRVRQLTGTLFTWICFLSTWVGLAMVLILLGTLALKAWGYLDWQFLSSFDSFRPTQAGILAGIWGSFWLMLLTAAISIPIGVGAAVFLEEYAPSYRVEWLTRTIQVNLANLAGVPSIVYGLLGLTVFVRLFHLNVTVLSGALTLSLLVLPVVIIAAQEALRSVPQSIRHASLALGATRWQTIWHQVLPASVPGIVTGVILAMSRAIGETAPLVVIGVAAYLAQTPGKIVTPLDMVNPVKLAEVPGSKFTALPLIIYSWATHSRPEYHQHLASAAILVLLGFLILMNGVAITIRYRFEKRTRW